MRNVYNTIPINKNRTWRWNKSAETCYPRQQLHLLEMVLCWLEWDLLWFTKQNATNHEEHIRSKMLPCYSHIVTKTSAITSLKGFRRRVYAEQPFPLTLVPPGPPTPAIVVSQGGQAYWITVPTGQASDHVFHHSVRSTFCNSHRTNRGGSIKAFIFFLSSSFSYILMMFLYLKPSILVMYSTGACISKTSVGKFYSFSFSTNSFS
jgi:hypothetical protein